MDKKQTVEFLKKLYNNCLTDMDIQTLLYDYCMEMGKEDDEKLGTFIALVSALPGIGMNHYVAHALRYYKIKHDVTEVYVTTGLVKQVIHIY